MIHQGDGLWQMHGARAYKGIWGRALAGPRAEPLVGG